MTIGGDFPDEAEIDRIFDSIPTPASVIDLQTRARLNGSGQQKEEPTPEPNGLRGITINPAQWEGTIVPPRRWLSKNRIPMCEVTGLGGDGGIGKTQIALQLACTHLDTKPGLARLRTQGNWAGDILHRRRARR